MADVGLDWFNAISNLRERRAERDQQIYQNGKIADSIAKNNPEMLQGLGMSPEQFGAQSAQDKAAAITGVFQAAGYKKAMLDLQNLKLNVDAGADSAPYQSQLLQAQADQAPLKTKMLAEQLKALQTQNAEAGQDATAEAAYGQRVAADPNAPQSYRDMIGSGIRPRNALEYSKALRGLVNFTPGGPMPIEGSDYLLQQTSPQGYTTVPGYGARSGKQAGPAAPNEPWIYTDDDKAFLKKLLEIDDPAARDAVLAVRHKYNLSNGKGAMTGPMKAIADMLAGPNKGGGDTSSSSSAGTGAAAATTATGGGKRYKYDPKTRTVMPVE